MHLLKGKFVVAVGRVAPGVLLYVGVLVVVDADAAVTQPCGEILHDARFPRAGGKNGIDAIPHGTSGDRQISTREQANFNDDKSRVCVCVCGGTSRLAAAQEQQKK